MGDILDFLDFGGSSLKRGLSIAVLIYFALFAFGVLPESLTAGDIIGIPFMTIAGVISGLAAYWIGSKLLVMT